MLLVRLLGPVDVVSEDGSVLQSGSALRRTLLALLALHPGQVLAPDWLMEHVWGDEQPGSGLRALRFHVSQLRKEIGAAVSIETRPGGYALDVSRHSVDALRFDDQAHEARIEADDARAADRCAAALELWRGAPFVDAAGCPTLDNEAARLEELRLTVVEHAHACRLAVGAGSELIADLSQLVRDHPLREGLWSSLIVAYYRAGQQADALRTYERLRAALADSLGIDPSPELQDLQLRVLQQDPHLLSVGARGGAAGKTALPTGTVTLLLSDVERSTRQWQETPEAMAVAVPRLYELLDEAIVGRWRRVRARVSLGCSAGGRTRLPPPSPHSRRFWLSLGLGVPSCRCGSRCTRAKVSYATPATMSAPRSTAPRGSAPSRTVDRCWCRRRPRR